MRNNAWGGIINGPCDPAASSLWRGEKKTNDKQEMLFSFPSPQSFAGGINAHLSLPNAWFFVRFVHAQNSTPGIRKNHSWVCGGLMFRLQRLSFHCCGTFVS